MPVRRRTAGGAAGPHTGISGRGRAGPGAGRRLAWLGTRLVPALRARGLAGLRGHGLEVAYGLASLAYIAVEGVLVVALDRVLVRGWLAPLLPAGVAGLGWAFAAIVIALTVAGVAADLRGVRAVRA